MTERVELREAFTWDCPDCGQENFTRAIQPELSPEEEQELKDAFGFGDTEEGLFLLAPKQVKCCHCALEWDTADPNGECWS